MDRPDNAIDYHEGSIDIMATPEEVYALVSDLPRMGEWSGECTGGRWMDGGTGKVGDWFEGTNRSGEREWVRECEVAVADIGQEFTFVVGGIENDRTTWSYRMEPVGDGTRLTERWWIVNKSPALLQATPEQYRARVDQTERAIAETLAAVKRTAEGS